MPPKFEGSWSYRSFFDQNVELTEGQLSKNAWLAVPWTTEATIEVSTNEQGEVLGDLVFPIFPDGVSMTISGKTIEPPTDNPAANDISGGVILTGKLGESEYQLKGWFIPNSNNLVGTIVSISKDLAEQPDGTSGPFVAFLKSSDA